MRLIQALRSLFHRKKRRWFREDEKIRVYASRDGTQHVRAADVLFSKRAQRDMELVEKIFPRERAMTEYKIRTLQDIFNLPTYELVERCLSELKRAMLIARSQADLVAEVARTLAAQDGVELPPGNYSQWPEECIWRDDDDGTFEHQLNFKFPDGEVMRTVISGTSARKDNEGDGDDDGK